jgi:hypothetical protein
VTEHDSDYRLGNAGRKVFRWWVPRALGFYHEVDRVEYCFRARSGDEVGSTLDGFRSLGNLSQRDIGYAENARFLLNGTAVGEYAQRVLLEANEVEKAEWLRYRGCRAR